jgi:hypothetical protein
LSRRAEQLHGTADTQIAELIGLIREADGPIWHSPCPGREKLGDGTIGAAAAHAAENYQRIAAFAAAGGSMSSRHVGRQRHRHRLPGLRRAVGNTPPEHDQAGPHGHDDGFTAEGAEPRAIIERLAAARGALAAIAALTDEQLDGVAPKDSFRFCDGQRTLEQVLSGLLKHQDHQVQALRGALTRSS